MQKLFSRKKLVVPEFEEHGQKLSSDVGYGVTKHYQALNLNCPEADIPLTLKLTERLREMDPDFAKVVAVVNSDQLLSGEPVIEKYLLESNAFAGFSDRSTQVIIFAKSTAELLLEATDNIATRELLLDGIKHMVHHELGHQKTRKLRLSKTSPEYAAELSVLSKFEDPIKAMASTLVIVKIDDPELSLKAILQDKLLGHFGEYRRNFQFGLQYRLIARVRRIELPVITEFATTFPFPITDEACEKILTTADQIFGKYLAETNRPVKELQRA